MKIKTLIILVAILLGTLTADAQRTATTTVKNIVISGSNYSFDIYAHRTNATGSILVGNTNFIFDVDQTGAFNFATTPALTNINANYTSTDRTLNDYGPMSVQWSTVGGIKKVNVFIDFAGNNTGAGTSLSTAAPDGELMCTVTLAIANAAKTANLTWDATNSGIATYNLAALTNSYSGSDNSLLPVEMTSLTGSAVGVNSAIIRWSTATERNNSGFAVERRAEGGAWAQVAFVAGAGTSSSPKEYAYQDKAGAGVFMYRLKQIDNSGAFKYSSSVEVNLGVAGKKLQLGNYPNPFNPSTEIQFSVPEDGFATLKVYNMIGQEVATLFSGVAKAGHYMSATFNASRFASGVYLSRLEYNGKSMVQRMLLAK